MTKDELYESLSSMSDSDIVEVLSRRSDAPDADKCTSEIEPEKHKVFDTSFRPDRFVKVPDPQNDERIMTVPVKVGRIGLSLQKKIVNSAIAFLFGNTPKVSCSPVGKEVDVYNAVVKILTNNKNQTANRQFARSVFEYTESAEYIYVDKERHNKYGFDCNYKIKTQVFSPANGDKLFPLFDDRGDLIAFSREYKTKDINGKSVAWFECYTDKFTKRWRLGGGSGSTWELVEDLPNAIGKIPIVYASQNEVEWADVQNLIERLEVLLSNFADTNDYHSSPTIIVQGEIDGFAQKGDTNKILKVDENAKVEYLTWSQASDSVKLEIDTLLKMVYNLSHTPNLAFDNIKGINVSGVAIRLMLTDAHLKVQDHKEVFDDYLYRKNSVILAFLSKICPADMKDACLSIQLTSTIVPYMIDDLAYNVQTLSEACGNKSVMSQETAVRMLGVVDDPIEELTKIREAEDDDRKYDVYQPLQRVDAEELNNNGNPKGGNPSNGYATAKQAINRTFEGGVNK